MRTKSFSLELTALLVLLLIPWPGPSVFKISCPRDSASVVRKLVQKKWMPILEKRSVKLGLECPFHPSRDIFGVQQAAKRQHRPSQWACTLCGKSFYTERHLEQHFDSRHRDSINTAEDAVCLADYCDVMRCEVLAAREAHSPGSDASGTDVEVWRSSNNMAPRTALSVSAPRDLARVAGVPSPAFPSARAPGAPGPQSRRSSKSAPRCAQDGGRAAATKDKEGDANATADRADGCGGGGTLVDSSVPPPSPQQQQRLSAMQRFKADCKPEELVKLKTRCETLVRDCIAGLLVNLSVQDFKEMEEELNRASCWYLTCDRYWEDSPAEARVSPWMLLGLMVVMLTLGVVVCYYIIWVLFDSREPWCETPSHRREARDARTAPWGAIGTPPYSGSPGDLEGPRHADDYYQGELDAQGDQYIYVAYPPDLKRRLLERPPPTPPAPAMQYHQHHQNMPMATSRHYPMHPAHSSPSPHLSHASQMSHMQHLAQMPRASVVGHLSGSGASPKQDPNPFEREWRI